MIIFLSISNLLKHMFGMLKRTVSLRRFFWAPTTYVMSVSGTSTCSARVYVQLSKISERKIMIIFLSISLNMCLGCSKEPSHWDSSFEYPQHMFWLRFFFSNMHSYLETGKGLIIVKLNCSTYVCVNFSSRVQSTIFQSCQNLASEFVKHLPDTQDLL